MREQWITVDALGPLYMDVVLITFNIPELFVCEDGNRGKYLAVLLDEDAEQFLLVKVTTQNLLNMLEGKIAIDATFRTAEEEKVYFIMPDKKGYKCDIGSISEVPPSNLPDSGVNFTLKNKKIDLYKESLQKLIKETQESLEKKYNYTFIFYGEQQNNYAVYSAVTGRNYHEEQPVSIQRPAGFDLYLVSA